MLNHFLIFKSWSILEKCAIVKSLTIEDTRNFAKAFLSTMHLQVFVHGNFLEEEARHLYSRVLGIFSHSTPLLPSHFPERRVLHLPQGKSYLFREECQNKDENNSAIPVYFQIGIENYNSKGVLDLIAQIMAEPFFDQLRTKEQLGYVTMSRTYPNYGILGFSAEIQSSVKDPDYLLTRIDTFLKNFREEYLVKISDETYQTNINSLITQFLEKDKNLYDETYRHWNEISSHRYRFDKVKHLVSVLKSIKDKQPVFDFFDRYISRSSPVASCLIIQVYGNQHPISSSSTDSSLIPIDHPENFKRCLPYYPDLFFLSTKMIEKNTNNNIRKK